MNEIIKKLDEAYSEIVALISENKELKVQLNEKLKDMDEISKQLSDQREDLFKREERIRSEENGVEIYYKNLQLASKIKDESASLDDQRRAMQRTMEEFEKYKKGVLLDMDIKEKAIDKKLAQLEHDRANYRKEVLEEFRKNVKSFQNKYGEVIDASIL